MALLTKDTTNAQMRSITRNLKGKREAGQVKDGGLSEQQLDLLERFGSSKSPEESPFLGACCNGAIIELNPLMKRQ
jgi:hypothetical protein